MDIGIALAILCNWTVDRWGLGPTPGKVTISGVSNHVY